MSLGERGVVALVVRNAASQTGGRIVLTLLRFGVAVVVLRLAGLDMFGQYALVLTIVVVAEWIADFGQTDIAVREIAAAPSRRGPTLAALAVSKAMLGCLGAFAACAAVFLLGYPPPVLQACLIAALSVPIYAAVLVYRVESRAAMRMERDVGSEIISACALLLSTWMVAQAGATLVALAWCHVGARAVYLLASAGWVGGPPAWRLGPEWRRDVSQLVSAAVPLGLVGLLVCAYDSMDALALAHWAGNSEIGIFSASMRILLLAVIVVQALALAVFPVLARQWAADRAAFVRTMQATLDAAAIVGGALFCALSFGALGIAHLLGQEPQAIASVLGLLSWAILARVVTAVIGPMVIVAGRQIHTVWLTVLVVVSKGAALAWLVPLSGARGVAWAYLFSEVVVGLLPTILVCQRVTGVRLNWSVPLRVLAAVVAVAAGTRLLGLSGSLLHGALAGTVFLLLCGAFRAFRIDDLRQLRGALAQRGMDTPPGRGVAPE